VAADLHVSKALVAPRGDRVAFTTPKRFERDGSQQILFDLLVSDSAPSAAPRLVARDIRLDYDGAQFSWSPDGTHLAYRTAGVLASGDVFVIGLDAAEPRLVSPTPHPPFTVLHQRMAPSWDARGRHVLFADTGAVWAASLADGQLTAVARLAGQSVRLLTTSGGGVLSPDRGLTTLVIATDMRTGKTAFCRVRFPPTPEGAAESSCVARDGSVGGYGPNDGAAVSDDGTLLVFASQDASHAPDLYLARHGDVTAATRLTAIAPAFDRVVMGEQRIISWRTGDGDTVRGVLLLPAGYQTGKRYPLITRVYGGIQPSRLYVDRFGVERPAIDNLQVLATRGYAILLPDIVFKGEGEVLSQLPKIVLPGVERVVELGIADSSRLGLMGHSFGGFNTIAMLTQTSRFRAAVMSAGTADVVATYGQLLPDGTSYGIAVVEHGQFLMNGTPWEQPRRYLDNSPVWHLDRVTTPLLIVHGGADHAVAPFLAEQVFVGLRRLGKPVVYAKYAGEEHHQATWSYANQLDYWNRVIAWFDTYLKGERR
jgi:dipeptidyl aminopeptidase/acylaminoacyl peptidase